jgi:hypothetical protein
LVIRHGASPELSLFRGKLTASHDNCFASEDKFAWASPQATEIEIAQMRDLVLQFAHRCGHDGSRRAPERLRFAVTGDDPVDAFIADLVRPQVRTKRKSPTEAGPRSSRAERRV